MEDGICMKLVFRTGFEQDKQAAFEKVQSAFSQQVAKTVDPYVPFDTGTLKNSVLQASDFKHGLLIHNTPYARRQYYLHPQGECLHGDGMLRGSYWGQRALADHRDALETFAHDRLRRKLCGRLRQVHCR